MDIASLAAFRVAFGAIMVIEVWRYFSKGWIERYYIAPTFHFGYEGFAWVRPWPSPWIQVHFLLLGFFALCVALGLWYRAASIGLCVSMLYLFLLDQANYLNHFYFICLLALLAVFMPANRAFSLDVKRRPELRLERIPAWTLNLLRAQVGIVYVYGGIAKLNADWLRGEPMRMWLAERTDFPLLGRYFQEEWMVYLFAYGGLLIDLLIVPALLFRPTRRLAFGLALAFHLLNVQLFSIGVFPWLMLAATTLYFEPDWARWLIGEASPESAAKAPEQTAPLGPWPRNLIGTYLALQLLVPLRHHLYSGDVNWTEEGHRFSWRMKLRTKDSHGFFQAIDPETEEMWVIDPDDYLSQRQHRKMLNRPELIRLFCHHVADLEEKRRGGRRPAIHARVTTSLNGREPQLLVDPSFDLGRVPASLKPARWIVPLDRD